MEMSFATVALLLVIGLGIGFVSGMVGIGGGVLVIPLLMLGFGFSQAKANGTMSNQPAPEYLQGAIIGLDNATGDILALVGGRGFGM